MADNPTPASGAPSDAAGMTPEQAHAELDRLHDDRNFIEGFTAGRPSYVKRFNEVSDATKGLPKPAPPPAPVPDVHTVGELTVEQLTPEQRSHYEKLFGVPTDPSVYEINLGGFSEGADPDTIMAADARFRGWMMEARAPIETGNAIAAEVLAEAQRVSSMTDEEWTRHSGERLNKLQLLWGSETDSKLDLANKLLDDVERRRPGLKSWLSTNRVGSSSGLVVLLAQIASERYGNAASGASGATGLTPREVAQARLEELRSDRTFGARYLSGDPVAVRELDALQRAALGVR